MEKLKAEDFDTIILDLDFTIWHGCRDKFWAKSLQFPIKRDKRIIFDKNGDYITLDVGIDTFLIKLTELNKNIGFITRGGFLDTKFDDQPSIICLKEYGIFNHFNYNCHVLYKDDYKSDVFQPLDKTLFIDDNERDLSDINSVGYKNTTVLNRNSFKKWKELL